MKKPLVILAPGLLLILNIAEAKSGISKKKFIPELMMLKLIESKKF